MNMLCSFQLRIKTGNSNSNKPASLMYLLHFLLWRKELEIPFCRKYIPFCRKKHANANSCRKAMLSMEISNKLGIITGEIAEIFLVLLQCNAMQDKMMMMVMSWLGRVFKVIHCVISRNAMMGFKSRMRRIRLCARIREEMCIFFFISTEIL